MAGSGTARLQRGLRPAAAFWCGVLLHLCISSVLPVSALDVGIRGFGRNGTMGLARCSRTCESEHCSVPPLLRYGKYCGVLYSGCPGEKPCDRLDACCRLHDACVQANHDDYLNVKCSRNFLRCIARVKKSGRATFRGNKCSVPEVVDLLTVVMKAALVAGEILHRP